MWRRSVFLCFFSVVLAIPAFAFERPFPSHAKRGKMTPAVWPEIVIEGKTRRLAPGARIWNKHNLIEMPSSLRGRDMTVNYTEDHQGDIDRVWILSEEEAQESIQKQTNSQPR